MLGPISAAKHAMQGTSIRCGVAKPVIDHAWMRPATKRGVKRLARLRQVVPALSGKTHSISLLDWETGNDAPVARGGCYR